MGGIIPLVLRGVQLLFAIVVLGLAVDLDKEFRPYVDAKYISHSLLTSLDYSAFTGGLGIIAAAVGLTALFLDAINNIITLALDALAALCFMCGGIAMSVVLAKGQCDSPGQSSQGKRVCSQARADSVFSFLSFLLCIFFIGYTFIKGRGSGSGGIV